MLVFSKQRLVFLSVPKTGTTAWQAALAPHASMTVSDPPELKHAPLFRYNRFFRPMLERFVGADLHIVAVMREPIDWLGSWYRYRQRPFLDGKPVSTRGLGFEEFVLDYLQGKPPPRANVGSQSKFLEPQHNGTAVTHLFRYDDQAGLTQYLEARLGVSIATERLNASDPVSLDLSNEVEARLRHKYACDFRLYDGIGSQGAYQPVPAPRS